MFIPPPEKCGVVDIKHKYGSFRGLLRPETEMPEFSAKRHTCRLNLGLKIDGSSQAVLCVQILFFLTFLEI